MPTAIATVAISSPLVGVPKSKIVGYRSEVASGDEAASDPFRSWRRTAGPTV